MSSLIVNRPFLLCLPFRLLTDEYDQDDATTAFAQARQASGALEKALQPPA